MRIHLLSDLHLEAFPWEPPDVEADIVVLAGDIHNGLAGLRWAGETFSKPVLYVPGNHEYDWHDLRKLRASFREKNWPDHVHLLDDRVITIDGVRFLGTTLYTDFALYGNVPKALDAAGRCMSDFVRIRNGTRSLRPMDQLEMHRQALEWLHEQLSVPCAGNTVVISHHCPHGNSIDPKYADSPANPGFASDLSAFILSHNISTWLHGHTHVSLDYLVGDTRIVCNPRGYATIDGPENLQFQPDLIVEIPSGTQAALNLLAPVAPNQC